ncbi:phosphotransferase [Microlunatus elymi]|nr:phosphotransferase [Microlunatus elymi]
MQTPTVLVRVAAQLRKSVAGWERPECGLSAAERWVARFSDGSSVFVKAATDELTAGWLRNESDALQTAGTRFGPEVVGWLSDDEFPVLITQDLSDGYWPAGTGTVQWRQGDMDIVLHDLGQLSSLAGVELSPIPEVAPHWEGLLAGDALIGAGLCSPRWIATYGADLISSELPAGPTVQRALVHGDVRSDNLCILPSAQARFVDWSQAGAGHPLQDLITLLPTLRLEGGPRPSTLLAEPSGLIVRHAGAAIARALSDRNGPSWLRQVLFELATINLQWVCDVLGLAPAGRVD